MLAIIWQIVRLISVKDINLRDCNQIYLLLKDGEDVADLLKLPAEEILKRWMNYHLAKAGQEPINNLGKDLADSRKLLYVLHQLDGANCPLDAALAEADDIERAGMMIANSKNMKPDGCEDVVGKKDIVKGNPKVNILLVAEIFNTKHGLDEEVPDFVIPDYDDGEGSKEEKAFRLWINSLGIEGVFVSNLYDDL